MTEDLASGLPEIMPLLGAEQSHGVENENVRQTLHVLWVSDPKGNISNFVNIITGV